MEYDEQKIIQQCKQGNIEHFALLYDHYIKKIYDFIYFRTFHKETAEDITSQVFTKALDKINSFNPSKGSFSSWLYQIAKNSIIDNARNKKDSEDLSHAEHISTKENLAKNIADTIDLQKVHSYLQTLSKEQQDVVIMRVWDELSYKEISEITGKSEASLKMTFSRTLEKLHKEFLTLAIISILIK